MTFRKFHQVKYKPRKEHTDAVKSAPLTIRNGWVTRGSQIMTRGTYPHKSEPGTTGWQGVGQAKAVIFFIIVAIIALAQNKITTSKEVQD